MAELALVVGLVVAQTACAFGHTYDDGCPRHPDGYLEFARERPLTWKLPDGAEPVLTVWTERVPGPVRRWDVDLMAVEGGWMFDLHGPRSNIYVGTPNRPCATRFDWEMTLGLPGREPWGPIPLPPLHEWSTVHVCPWDDEDNCLEVGIFP